MPASSLREREVLEDLVGGRPTAEACAHLRPQGKRLAALEFRDPEVPAAEQAWSLTRQGVTAAVELVSFAGRVIGWPPAPPSTLR